MTILPAALLALAATTSPTATAPARDAFILVSGADTVAVEHFTSTTLLLEGELFLRPAGLRSTYRLECDAAGLPLSMHLTTTRRSDPAGAPGQDAAEFRDDSVVVTLTPGGPQRFATHHGALPYLNPSMAMIERAVRRARAMDGDSATAHLFALAGGRTLRATVVRLGADSVRVRLAGVEMRFALGPDGDLRSGYVPAQGLRVVRGDGATPATFAPPDYSAPAGAPCTAEDVRVPCTGGFALAGTMTRPRGVAGRVPCVVTLTGSGLQDRDESLPILRGYRPFRQVADALARAGIATLRLDDRGYGASGGDAAQATTADFAADARAALAWLRARSDVDGARLALVGHSEGGLIAPMVAAGDPALRAIVLLAGPAWPGRRVIEYQNRLAIARQPDWPAARRDSMLRVAMKQVDSLATTNPWLHYFLTCDPLPTARRVRCPVLVLQGATDHQVAPAQATELAQALRDGGDRDVTLSVLAGTDHLFLPDTNGDPAGYAALPETEIRPEILATITDWLRTRLR